MAGRLDVHIRAEEGSGSDAPPTNAQMAELSHQFLRSLQESGIEANEPEQAPIQGQRGDTFSFGQFVMALASSGAITALFQCIKAYIDREKSITVEFTDAAGKSVKVTEKNVDNPDVRLALSKLIGS